MSFFRSLCSLCALCVFCGESLRANPPVASYIFPAGGQRGTSVNVRVGGLFLHEKCGFEITGRGVTASPQLSRTNRIWFEGPILPLPESQQQEDYPADMLGTVSIVKAAPLGPNRVRLFTSQGGASGPLFVVGELPEAIEREIDGDPIPEPVALPLTANGRIFPREDIDLWEFDAAAGQTVTAFAHGRAINSPLVPRLDILDASGNVVAEQALHARPGTDAYVRFTAKVSGKHRVRITDARTLGGPASVYRLTITTADVPNFDFPLKVPADGLRDTLDSTQPHAPPIALNGRIEKPGAVNEWRLELKKDRKYTFDLQARRFESPLCGSVVLLDASGKELARRETDVGGDPGSIAFAPPADGTFAVRITERFRGRGGPNFVYRLRVLDDSSKAEQPSFRLTLPSDVFSVSRGGTVKLTLGIERTGSFTGPIVVSPTELPQGVTAKAITVPANGLKADLTLLAAPDAAIGSQPLKIAGTGVVGLRERIVSPPAVYSGPGAAPDVKLVVGMATPFKIVDQYVMTSAPRGEVYRRKYRIDRGGFDGPITVTLADKQARHLQGVTGPVVVVPPGETEFEYPAVLPSWMEMGRTCRVCVVAVGVVKDETGKEHAVSFSSVDQNQQMIVVVGPGRLGLDLGRGSVLAKGEVRVPVTVSRGDGANGVVTVEALLPAHWKGVTAKPIVVPAGGTTGELVLTFEPNAGPFNMPLTLRATTISGSTPVTAEAKLDLVKCCAPSEPEALNSTRLGTSRSAPLSPVLWGEGKTSLLSVRGMATVCEPSVAGAPARTAAAQSSSSSSSFFGPTGTKNAARTGGGQLLFGPFTACQMIWLNSRSSA